MHIRASPLSCISHHSIGQQTYNRFSKIKESTLVRKRGTHMVQTALHENHPFMNPWPHIYNCHHVRHLITFGKNNTDPFKCI